ncbi:MAG TPA: hypothetical protein VNS58_28225 [Puia sp.]|nr:hypothetical protein [Puia sp.]
MQELTQPLGEKPGQNPDPNRALITQCIDFEKDKSPQYQRQMDLLSQLCSIENDMKGATGSLEGLFGM